MFGNSVSYNGSMDDKDFSNFKEILDSSDYSPVQFPDFETIPGCTKYTYPDFESLVFIPPINNAEWEVFNVDGLKMLSSLGEDQFTISPIKWDRVKEMIASGKFKYPESTSEASLLDGRHRTLALMKIYGLTHVPYAVLKEDVEQFLINAKAKALIN